MANNVYTFYDSYNHFHKPSICPTNSHRTIKYNLNNFLTHPSVPIVPSEKNHFLNLHILIFDYLYDCDFFSHTHTDILTHFLKCSFLATTIPRKCLFFNLPEMSRNIRDNSFLHLIPIDIPFKDNRHLSHYHPLDNGSNPFALKFAIKNQIKWNDNDVVLITQMSFHPSIVIIIRHTILLRFCFLLSSSAIKQKMWKKSVGTKRHSGFR